MNDTNCPYCNAEVEINHDDGYGYREDETFQQECGECEKTFTFTTSIHFYYSTEKAPCLNGEEHKWEQIVGYPKEFFFETYRCYYCDEETCKDPEGKKLAMKSYFDEMEKSKTTPPHTST